MIFEAIRSIYESLANYLPNIIAGIAVLILGFFVGKITKYLIVKLSEIFNLKELAEKSGIDKIIKKIKYSGSTFELVGDLFKWSIYVLFVIATLKIILGEQMSMQLIMPIVIFLPRIIVASITIIIGIILSEIVGGVVKNILSTVGEKWKAKKVISSLSEILIKVLIILIALAIALDLLGIYAEVITVGFGLIFFSMIILIVVGAKDLLLNLFAGLYLQSTDKLHKGVKISISGIKGKIEEIGLIYTTIKSGKKEISLPNYIFIKEKFFVE